MRAAEDAARAAGVELRVGPFGTLAAGEGAVVLEAVAPIVRAAIGAGASRVTLQVTVTPADAGEVR